MSLASDLLEQSVHLTNRETAGPPKQASLRRAVSAAYYALFHLLSDEAAAVASSPTPVRLRNQVKRALTHNEMKEACVVLCSGKRSGVLLSLMGIPPANLVRVATAFVDLQEARHKADYDVTAKFSRTEVRLLVQQCQRAFTDWQSVRGSDEGKVFLAALLFHKRWSR